MSPHIQNESAARVFYTKLARYRLCVKRNFLCQKHVFNVFMGIFPTVKFIRSRNLFIFVKLARGIFVITSKHYRNCPFRAIVTNQSLRVSVIVFIHFPAPFFLTFFHIFFYTLLESSDLHKNICHMSRRRTPIRSTRKYSGCRAFYFRR